MISGPADFATTLAGGDFYVTGGTLRPDAPSYVERQADRELCEGLLRGEFCYVLTSRQMGKSSLMVRTVRRLRQEGVAVAVLDLTAIGQNLSIEQWYDGLLSRLGQQLDLEDEILAFATAHPELGPLQRWLSALEQVVLQRISGKVVVFVDEIDMVRSLSFSTDEFFAGIRECHNRRSRETAFGRLGFGLLGVATPTDLIRDTKMTPFNIGRRIELNDFTAVEAEPLARGLGADERSAQNLLRRILHWTGGHPYLTQRLCRAVADTIYQPPAQSDGGSPGATPPVLPTLRTVDQLADKLFLTRQARDRDDNLIFVRERLLRSDVDVAGLLLLYRRIHGGQLVLDDETNALVSILRLSGITRGVNGYLQVRNRIYWQVFDLTWVQTNMPAAEVRRQRRAGRRGMLIGFGIALFALLAYLLVHPAWTRYLAARRAIRTLQEVQSTYRSLHAYEDTFETTFDIGVGGVNVPVKGSGHLLFEKPNKISLALRSALNRPEIELRLVSDGGRSWIYVPSLEQFQMFEGPFWPSPFDLPPPIARHLGPARALPLYRLLLNGPAVEKFLDDAQNLHYAGEGQINGESVRVVSWEHNARAFAGVAGLRRPPAERSSIPITAWVSRSSHLVLQMSADVSCWADELCGRALDLPITTLQVSEVHKSIRTPSNPESVFRFNPAPGARLVEHLELPQPNFSLLASAKRQFLQLIPARLPQAPRNCIDLSEHYNAALVQSWHPGMGNNSLDVLPPGLLQLGGTVFDVRGIVQLAGKELQRGGRRSYPEKVIGIPVAQACRQLHFLHAAGWHTKEGTRIGSYIVHYADSREQTIPIIYGEDVRDWNAGGDASIELKRATIVWSATNKAPLFVRLFKSTWLNPYPDTEIASIDYISTVTESAPFLIAITAEQ